MILRAIRCIINSLLVFKSPNFCQKFMKIMGLQINGRLPLIFWGLKLHSKLPNIFFNSKYPNISTKLIPISPIFFLIYCTKI